VRERRSLAFAGVVIVALARSGRGDVLAEAEVALDGVPATDAGGRPMIDIVREAVEGTVVSIPRERRRDGEMVREAVRRAVRSAVERVWGKRPIAKVLLVRTAR
jgi:ribonuclease J